MFDSDTVLDTTQEINLDDISQIISTSADLYNTFSNSCSIIGSPDLYDWAQQIMPDNCAVEAERAILNLFRDTPMSQVEAMFISATNGWYMSGTGTSPDDIGQLLEMHGIPTHTIFNASITDLATELALGHGVIVGVDAEELWDSGPLADLKQWMSTTWDIDFGDIAANHAVLVTGLDLSDTLNPKVILNDSGVPDGDGVQYPMEKFLQAWQDSNFFYAATDNPLPHEQIYGNLDDMDMDSILSNLGLIIGGIAGTCIGAETYMETGEIGTAITTGLATATSTAKLIENLFSDDTFISSL